MTKRDQQTYALAAVIILIVAGIWFSKTKAPKNVDEQTNTSDQQNQQQNQPSNSSSSQGQTGNTWAGMLKASDNNAKGNLMLETGGRVVYLRTSRDFTQLVGKEVVVSYSGTLESFTLLDIKAK